MARVELHPEPIALSQETVDKLIGQGSGDAALLYLYLLRRGGRVLHRRRPKGPGLERRPGDGGLRPAV